MGALTGVIAVFLITVPLAAHANLSLDTAADAQCMPIATTECGCGAVLNPKTGWCEKGDNKYECICSQSDAGVVTTGTCQADGICHAISTGGKTPQKPSQQVQSQIGQQSVSSVPQVSPDTKNPAPSTNDLQSAATNPPVGSIGAPTPGQSLFQDALGQLQQISGGTQSTKIGGDNVSPDSQTGVSLWLSSGEVQLQPPDTSGDSQGDPYLGELPVEEKGSFNPAQQGLGTIGPSPQDAAYANTLVTAPSAADQAVVAAQNIGKGITETGGSWAQDALQYMDQSSPNSQQDYLTTYGVCNTPSGCDAIEGAPTTYSAHPDENGDMTHEIYTLDGYANGQYPYVTVAGARDQQGDTGVIPQITYKDASGQTQTLTNVPYMVADTGSTKYFPSGNSVVSETGGNHFDVPITVPQDLYPGVTGSSAQMNSFLDAQPYNSSVASVIPTDSLSQSYAVSDPWNAPATGGLPAYAQQDSTSFPQSDYAWTQSVPEMSQLASAQNDSQVASDAGAPDLTLSSADNSPAYPAGTVEQGPSLAQPYPAGDVTSAPIPDAFPNQADLQVGENAQLQDRLAQADAETTAYQQALNNAPSQVPVPDTSIQSGEDVTYEVAKAAAEGSPVAQSVPTPPVESAPLPPPEPSFTEKVSSALTSAGDSVQGWYQSTVDSLQNYAIDKSIPTPAPFEQTGDQVTANIQQTVASQIEASAAEPGGSSPLAGTEPPPGSVPQSAQLSEVPSAADQLTLLQTSGSEVGAANNGTVITSDLFDPNSVALGAYSSNPDIAQQIANATQFSPPPAPGALPENAPLPEPRPADAGATGINIAGCGGVCEYNNAGTEVTAIQQFLNAHGDNIAVDGIYGSQTENAVADFQKSQGIAVDGIVGPQTVAAMNSVAQQNLSVPQNAPGTPAEEPVPQAQPESVPLPQPRPSAADQVTLQQQTSAQPPQPTPMQLQAQRTENAFSASYSAYKSFINNPTQQSLARLVSSARYTQSLGLQFQNQTVQNFASQLGQMQQASGHSPWLVSSYLSSYRSQISAGFNTVRSVLNRYIR